MTNNTSHPLPKSPLKKIPGFTVSFRKTIAWTFIILILSFLPGQALEKVKLFDISFQDLIIHFLMYFVFAILLIKELSSREITHRIKRSAWIVALLATIILGSVTELVQHFCIPGRVGSLSDFVLNMSGTIVAILACRIPWFRKRFIGLS